MRSKFKEFRADLGNPASTADIRSLFRPCDVHTSRQHGLAWPGPCPGLVWSGLVLHGMVWYGTVRYGMVWYGITWHGTVSHGMVLWSSLA